MQFKRSIALLLALLLAAFCFASCGGSGGGNATQAPAAAADSSFSSSDGSITNLSVIQVMAKGVDAETGELYDMAQLVAGKSSVIYASFAEETDVLQDGSMVVSIEKDGAILSELLPASSGSLNGVYFIPRNIEDVGNWAAGDYKLTLTNGESTATRTASFRDANKIKVLAVPVIANYGGRVVSCTGEWQTAIQFTKDCYPLANDGIEYVLGNELDLSDDSFDLTTDEGCYNVWEALTQLQTPANDYELILGFVRERQGDGTLQGYTYGKPANIITESDGDMQPTVAHEIAHCYNVGDEYEGGTLNNAVNPAPYGMSGSDWVNRDETVQSSKAAVKSVQSDANYGSGSLISEEQTPLNATSLTTLPNVGSFMGSGSSNLGDYWITSDIWAQLFKAFTTGDASYPAEYVCQGKGASAPAAPTAEAPESGDGEAPEVGEGQAGTLACPVCGAESAQSDYGIYGYCESCEDFTEIASGVESFECGGCNETLEATGESVYLLCPSCGYASPVSDFSLEKVAVKADTAVMSGKKDVAAAEIKVNKTITAIDITGKVTSEGVFSKTPWYTYEAQRSDLTNPTTGEYSVVMKDAAGAELSRQYISVSFYTQSNPPVKNSYAPVNATVELPEGTAQIVLMQGDKALYTESVSANAPVVEFTGIKENASLAGKQKLAWNASDADGDALCYELWYCAAEDDWYSVATNLTATSYEVDLDKLPGSEQGYFYIFATDGVNTTGVDSPWIKVEYKAPQVLTAQPKKAEYKITDEILFTADVYDMQDGWLVDSESIKWTLKGVEFFTGDTLWVYPYELAPGAHTFTMTATNSQGKSVSRDYTLTVLDDETALPNDWSREDVKKALANGFVAPLANVGSAITRGQFAKLMSNLYWTVWEEGSPSPETPDELVTDCGVDDYEQSLMVALGVMEAPSGKFSPNGQLTQEEAAVIMYQLCALADPAVAEPTDDRAEMAQICVNSGVMDEAGENSYAPDKPITGQLALVRCNRLYDAIFGE